MKLIHQTIANHDPDRGMYGNCYQAALAMMFDADSIDEFPHFYQGVRTDEDAEEARKRVDVWMRDHYGLTSVSFPIAEQVSLSQIIEMMRIANPGVRYLLLGQSSRNVNHVVVIDGDGAIWDPSPYSDGLVGPAISTSWGESAWWIETFVPHHFREIQIRNTH